MGPKRRNQNSAQNRPTETASLGYAVHVGRDGGMYIDPDEAFQSDHVQRYVRSMGSLGKEKDQDGSQAGEVPDNPSSSSGTG